MALRKQIQLDTGVNADYIRITSIKMVDTQDRGTVCNVIIDVYFDRSKMPILTKSIEIPKVNNWNKAYEELKKHPDFINSEDILEGPGPSENIKSIKK